MLKKVVLIGGGAAGFFCAANLDENKFSVKILEQNKDVLQKVKISGGGRFNPNSAIEKKEYFSILISNCVAVEKNKR